MSEGPASTAGHVRDQAGPAPAQVPDLPLIIATIMPGEGTSGVQTHFRELRSYLDGIGTPSVLLTPFSWARPLTVPVFGLRLALRRVSKPAGVVWYRHWHEVFIRNALRRHLAKQDDCVIYAQCPLSARAALRARRGPRQRVVMAVHFAVSQADEWADKGQIARDGKVFRSIRRLEEQVIPQVDGLVYVSRWAQEALLGRLPEAAAVPSAIIGNFVAAGPVAAGPVAEEPGAEEPTAKGPLASAREPSADLVTVGALEPVKNHGFLLTVLAAASRAGYGFTLDVFGDGPLRGSLERQAQELGLAGQVRFRGFRTDVRDFLPGYRAYVHASYWESSSLAIMEAMAAGLPVVAGNIGAIAELCDDGVEARFWSLQDPEQAAATLIALLGSEQDRLTAGRAARERFRRDHDAAVVGPRLRDFLLGSFLLGSEASAAPAR